MGAQMQNKQGRKLVTYGLVVVIVHATAVQTEMQPTLGPRLARGGYVHEARRREASHVRRCLVVRLVPEVIGVAPERCLVELAQQRGVGVHWRLELVLVNVLQRRARAVVGAILNHTATARCAEALGRPGVRRWGGQVDGHMGAQLGEEGFAGFHRALEVAFVLRATVKPDSRTAEVAESVNGARFRLRACIPQEQVHVDQLWVPLAVVVEKGQAAWGAVVAVGNSGRGCVFGAALNRLVGGVECAVVVRPEAGGHQRVTFESRDGTVVGLPRKHADTLYRGAESHLELNHEVRSAAKPGDRDTGRIDGELGEGLDLRGGVGRGRSE